ncbi:hypothetical protein ABPG73_021035 [Tetrahymena malaccensis]
MLLQKIVRLTVSLLSIALSAQGLNCPNIEKYDNPVNFYKYIVQNMIVIPKTNILIINTMQQSSAGSSYVYYVDLVSAQIINTIKPSYQIVNMMYHKPTDQIVVQNKGGLLMTDPYTLKVLQSISGYNFFKLDLIEGTNYIIVSLYQNQCWVIDVSKQITVLQMDNYYNLDTFPDNSALTQQMTKYMTLSTGQTIIVISNDRGLISWTINLKTNTYKWNSYITPSIVKTQGDTYWSFSKHPTKDILFLVGAYQQILVLQINDIEKGNFTTLYHQSLNNYSAQNEYFINLNYIILQGQDIFVTYLGEYLYVYNVNFSPDFTSLTIQQTTNEWVDSDNRFSWTPYEQMNFIFIPSGNYISLYNYKENYLTYIFYFYGNRYNRRFVINYEGETEKIVLAGDNQVKLFDRKNFGYYPYDNNKQLSYYQVDDYAVFYQVKYTTNQFFIKTGDGKTDYLTTFQIYPLDQPDNSIDIYSKYGNYLGYFGSVLDPFFFNDAVWVGLPEPNKPNSKNYIISLLNCQSGDIVYLHSDSGDDTSINSAFGLASLEDPDNQEYFVFDNSGNIYSWDLSKPNFPFKSSLNFDCSFAYIAEVFQYQKIKRLLFFCPDNYVYSLDFQTGKYSKIIQLTMFPTALKAISRLQLVLIGDFNTGVAYIFKYDPVNDQFNVFLKFKPTKTSDQLNFIDILEDNTLWIQYQYSNIFYSIGDCLNDPQQCLECTQQYYFDATNQYDEYGYFGYGLKDYPFTTSYNFFTSMIKNLVFDVTNMNVEIIISPDNALVLNPNFMNFDFNDIISLSFQSLEPGTYATIQYFNQLKLQDYNFIEFQDVAIQFDLTLSSKCGLNFQNIQNGILLNNIQLSPLVKPAQVLSCQQIYSDNSPLNIQKYIIQNEDFTNHSQILSSLNNNNVKQFFKILSKHFIFKQITISNFSLLNCALGDNFSVLSQISNVDVYINNLTINDNICSNLSSSNKTSFLFTGGLFQVNGMNMNNNQFCRKSIFSTIVSLQQSNYVFKFINIVSNNNSFQVRTTYIFFNALYSLLIQPDHQLILQNVTFSNNQLSVQDSKDLKIAQYFETIKISSINMQQVNIINHYNIQLSLMQYIDSAIVIDFNCTNDQAYLNQIPNQLTSSCIQLQEVQSVGMQNINILNKRSQDSSLILIRNYQTEKATFNCKIANFSDLSLIQNGINTYVSPIFIQSSYQIDVQIDQALFQNIFLQTLDYSITYSALALQVINFVGTLELKNSYFLNSYSQSIYGFIYAQTNTMILDTIVFNNQTFYSSSKQQIFKQQGGFINAQIENLNITKTTFNQSTATKGAFLYLLQFGKTFMININDAIFNEGYAYTDGGAIFIDTGNNQILLNCFNCQFSNIYTFQSQASSIGLQKYSQINNNTLNSIAFQGGYIKNVKGVLDNYFIDVVTTNLQFLEIDQILSEEFVSNSQPYQNYSLQSSNQQPALISNLQNSLLLIKNCTISNLNKTSFQTTYPLLVNSYASKITIQNTNIQSLIYTTSALQLVQSQISLIFVNFQNIYQLTQSLRLIQSAEFQTPSQNGASLISAQQSSVNINQNSLFFNINCSQNCNGGVLQVTQGSLNIQQTVFQNISSNFGGAIFISGLNKINSISDSQFIGCQSQNDGGAIYLSAQQGDIYGQYWPHSYAKSAKFSCTRCDQIKNNVWIVVLMTIWTLISMCLAIKGDVDVLREKIAIYTIQKNLSRKSTAHNRRQSSVQFKTMSFSQIQENKSIVRQRSTSNKFKMEFNKNEDKSGIFIKMLTNYVQIVGSIATFNLSIPSGIFEFPQSLGQPLKQTMNSLDCALQEFNIEMPIIYVRLLFSLTLPVIYMILFVLYQYLKNASGDINESIATLNQINNNQEDEEKQIELKQIFSNQMQAMQNSDSSPFYQHKSEKQGEIKLQKGNNKVKFNQTKSIQLENYTTNQLEQNQKSQEQDSKQISSSQIQKNQSNGQDLIQFNDQIESMYSENQDDRANTEQYFIDSNKFLIGLQPKKTLSDINYQNQNTQAKNNQQTLVFVEENDEIQYREQDEQNENNLKSRSPENTENNTQRNQLAFDSKVNLLRDKQSESYEKKSSNQGFKEMQGQHATILEEDLESLQHQVKENQNVYKQDGQTSILLIQEKNNIGKTELDIYSNKLIPGQHLTDTKLDLNANTQNLINIQNSQEIIYDQDIEVQVSN